MKIGQRALAQPAYRQVTLRLPRLTEIFDRPQAAQGGIEESQQMGDRHIVEEQPPIPVRRAAAQRAHMLFEHADVLAAGDRLRPVRQRIVDNRSGPHAYSARIGPRAQEEF